MRRLPLSALVVALTLMSVPTHAATTTAVFAAGNEYVLGDDDYGKEVGFPGLVGMEVAHLRGNQLQFTNTDIVSHTLTHNVAVSLRKFNTGIITPGSSVDVGGIAGLGNGTYPFKCLVHSTFMFGTLVVTTP